MKTKFLAVLLAIGLITPSLYAQRALRGLKNAGNAVRSLERGSYNIVKMPHIDIKPSLSTRVSAAVRGQTPALKRLQSIRKYQAYKGLVTQWRERNVSLAEELDFRGVIVTSLPNDGKMVDAFSADGKTWYAADDMLVNAVKDGRFVRFDEASGSAWFSPYKGGPEFEFYDEQLFKELDRSRELGISLTPEPFVGEGEWTGMLPFDIPGVKIFEGDPALFVPETKPPFLEGSDEDGANLFPWRASFACATFAFNTSDGVLSVTKLLARENDFIAKAIELGKKVMSFNGRFNIDVIYGAESDIFLIQDSRGVLHEPKDFDAVIQAEEKLSLPAVRVETPKIDIPNSVDFEEVL